jgi:hypothetical protein
MRRGPAFVMLSAFATALAVVVHVVIHWRGPWSSSSFAWSAFRDYYASDQLAYLAIVVNGANGVSTDLEPFTQTGRIDYPRLYYVVLGAAARFTGVEPTVAWAVGGLVVQSALVAAIGVVLVLVTRRWWAAVFAVVPFVIGTLAVPIAGTWYMSLDSHAVLWGPFAVLFSLNGEVFGLALAAIGFAIAVVAVVRPMPRRRALVMLIVAFALVGVTSNVQTYSFLTGTSLLLAMGSGVVIARRRSWVAAAATMVLILLVYAIGPTVAATVGPLVTLGFAQLPWVPGIILALREFAWRALLPLASLTLAAAPQIVATVLGMVSGDPFLTYRVASSEHLGVDWRALVASLVLVVPLAAVAVAGWRTRRPVWVGIAAGAAIGWLLLSTNDVWGANQEPYRFFLDSMLLLAVVTTVLVAHALAELAADRRASGRRAPGLIVVVLAALVIPAISMLDFATFSRTELVRQMLHFDDVRSTAIAEAATLAPSDDAMIAMDPCISPFTVSVRTGRPVAHFNLGMAWPADIENLRTWVSERQKDRFALAPLLGSDVEVLLTDDACASDWDALAADLGFTPIGERPYLDTEGDPRTITAWLVEDPR